MTLQLEINPQLERRLKRTAHRLGLGTEQCALRLLQDRLSEDDTPETPLEADPLMAMAGVDDFEPAAVDEVVYR